MSDSLRPYELQHKRLRLTFTISQSLLWLMSIEIMPSNHLILCSPLLLLPSILPNIRVFSNDLALCFRWSKYWKFSFSISFSNEYSGLTFFRIYWFDLLDVQGALNSLLQHHSSKTSILRRSAFFIVQLSHPDTTLSLWLYGPLLAKWCLCLLICCLGLPSVQFSSVTQSCLIIYDPMYCKTPDLPVYHQLPEFTQTHAHWVGDVIQPSHPLSSPSHPAFNLFQHQGLFQWVSSLHQVAKVLELQLQNQSFQWIFRTDLL